MGTHGLTGPKEETESSQILKDLVQPIIADSPNQCKKAQNCYKNRKRASKKMLPFVVSSRLKPLKKHNGFRRRSGSGRQNQSFSVAITDSEYVRMTSISRR